MPSVVIIHAADDALPARALGEKLRLAKLTPVTEQSPGEQRQTAVKGAPVAIALWSPRSVADPGVAVDVGFARGPKLVHACMQSVRPPGDFVNERWVDLTGWRGEDDFAAWQELAALVTEKAGVAPLPPPAPRPASGFFQPGRVAESGAPVGAAPQAPRPQQPQPAAPRAAAPPPPPPPRDGPAYDAPAKSGGPNMALIGIITFLVVAIAGGGGYYFWSQSQGDGAAVWASVDQTDPAELRAFLAGQPGALRAEAEAALDALEQARYADARRADTIEAFEAFVADFPRSDNVLAARGRIAELRAQPETPEQVELPEELTAPAEPLDPDLVPPGAATPTPAPVTPPPATGGPVPLSPAPQAEPDAPAEPEEPGPTPG